MTCMESKWNDSRLESKANENRGKQTAWITGLKTDIYDLEINLNQSQDNKRQNQMKNQITYNRTENKTKRKSYLSSIPSAKGKLTE